MWRRLLTAFDSSPNTMEAPTALVLVAFVALLVFQSVALFLGHQFDAYSYGMAVGMIMGGGGVASYGQGYMLRSRMGSDSMLANGTGNVDDPDAGGAA